MVQLLLKVSAYRSGISIAKFTRLAMLGRANKSEVLGRRSGWEVEFNTHSMSCESCVRPTSGDSNKACIRLKPGVNALRVWPIISRILSDLKGKLLRTQSLSASKIRSLGNLLRARQCTDLEQQTAHSVHIQLFIVRFSSPDLL